VTALLAGLLAWAQSAVQNNRAVPELAHRAFGRFSTVGAEPFLDAHSMPWTSLIEQHYPEIRCSYCQVVVGMGSAAKTSRAM